MVSLPAVDLSAAPRGRTALLIFARSVTSELNARGWPRRFAGLLAAARLADCASTDIEPHWFTDRLPANLPPSGNVHLQSGHAFGERLHHAVETLAAQGYARLIIVGGDCPDLSPADIAHAAALLDRNDAVLGPDHRGGTYLIGLHTRDRHLLDAIAWQRHTDLLQLQSLFAARTVALLPVKIELDRWIDLKLFARRDGRLPRWLAGELTFLIAAWNRTAKIWVDLARQSERARQLLSPPLSANC